MRARGTRGAGTGRRHATRSPLTVERCPTGYVLRDPDLARLSGLDALPLPFTPEASGDEVLTHLRRLNPHREVRIQPPHPSSPASGANRQVGEASDIPHPSCD